ncbi:heparinase II/III family protein [Govanella unica]|uniref:Heparinase II/III family protein n=1 Tax=Govanella unica TaxID=2975056 RepID=A0A9X3Z5U1_9PROT|nr:heparinase II/III family protein [Govania unica]MDA5192407.1 heparinase II/III family protein [Govania unica]
MSEIRRTKDAFFARTARAARHALKRAETRMLAAAVIASGPHPIRLLKVPKDPWPGDYAVGAGILAGRFHHAGQVLKGAGSANGEDPDRWTPQVLWSSSRLAPGWWDWLQGFSWLRDLATVADQAAARRVAEAHVRAWCQAHDRWPSPAWEPGVIGRRLLSWMTYAPLILASEDHVYRSRVLNSMARQARFLGLGVATMEPGPDRVTALVGLVASGLLLPNGESRLKQGSQQLAAELERMVQGDGGFLSRSPADLARVLRDLISLSAIYAAVEEPVSSAVTRALDRIVPALKALTHGDQRLAQFNGAYADGPPLLARLPEPYKSMDPLDNGLHTGFQRLARGALAVVIDGGPPPVGALSRRHHAGTGSFEMSLGAERVVVNCGSVDCLPDPAALPFGQSADDLGRLTRATAAHSTLVINDTNSSQILPGGLIGEGPSAVSLDRNEAEDGALLLDLEHDGYSKKFNYVHRRRFFLAARGEELRGEDTLEAEDSGARRTLYFDLRFHLHPEATPRLLAADEGVLIRLPSGRALRFLASGGDVAIEDSLYFGAPAFPRRTRQIVVSGRLNGETRQIRWAFRTV